MTENALMVCLEIVLLKCMHSPSSIEPAFEHAARRASRRIADVGSIWRSSFVTGNAGSRDGSGETSGDTRSSARTAALPADRSGGQADRWLGRLFDRGSCSFQDR